MAKKLPKIFVNKIDKKLNNNASYFVSNDKKIIVEKEDINKKINDIFKSKDYIYRAKVIITLESGDVIKKIIGKNGNQLITIDNELIDIDKILDIKLKKD